MAISALDLFKIGIGPSSSHTVGPMVAAHRFVEALRAARVLDAVTRVRVQLFGSLSATGVGHGTDRAAVGGLLGFRPDTVDPDVLRAGVDAVAASGRLALGGGREIGFAWASDLVFEPRRLPGHPNALTLTASGTGGVLLAKTYFSVGSGFVVDADAAASRVAREDAVAVEFPYCSGDELVEMCHESRLSVADLVRRNELAWRGDAVLHFFVRFKGGTEDEVVDFLLAATAIGALLRRNASISGAEVGCQGEVGAACAMAAAGLAQVLGGTPEQVEHAAEIGLEHNLGLTCDPIGGLVQIPCIERNAVGAMKAIHATQLALEGTGTHRVTLDQAIRTMADTGHDMLSKYKETSRGGLAVAFAAC